jgi:hypothetical protein
MEKLRAAGFQESFTDLESGIEQYVSKFLSKGKYYS